MKYFDFVQLFCASFDHNPTTLNMAHASTSGKCDDQTIITDN